VRDKAVKAALTVTFHKPKRGLLTESAKRYVGELVVEPIGIPPEAELVVGPATSPTSTSPGGPTARRGTTAGC